MSNPSERFSSYLAITPEFKKLDVPGGVLGYAVIGRGHPVVLLHGIDVGWGQWYPSITELSRFFKLYLVDLPGAGLSSSFRLHDTLERTYVDPLQIFLEHEDLLDAHIIGHSLGSWVAVRLALRGKSRSGKLLLTAPLGFSSYLPPQFYPVSVSLGKTLLSRFVVPRSPAGIEKILSGLLEDRTNLSPEFLAYYSDSLADAGPDAHPFSAIYRLCRPFRLHPELFHGPEFKGLSREMLCIMGDKDPLVPLGRVVSAFRYFDTARIEVYPHVGHVPAFEQPVQFNKDAISFLS